MGQQQAKPAIDKLDPVWARVRHEAEDAVKREPELATFIYSTILHRDTLEEAVIYRLSERLDHAAVSGERQGYYADFGSLQTLAQTLKHGYFHAGTYSSFRHRRHGRPLDTTTIPATRLLAYTLTHDQVGNRAVGDRLTAMGEDSHGATARRDDPPRA